jgi:hypothetical protein
MSLLRMQSAGRLLAVDHSQNVGLKRPCCWAHACSVLVEQLKPLQRTKFMDATPVLPGANGKRGRAILRQGAARGNVARPRPRVHNAPIPGEIEGWRAMKRVLMDGIAMECGASYRNTQAHFIEIE